MKNIKILSSEYATFRNEIQDYFRDKLLRKPLIILDPMAGTAPLIPFIETHGHTAYLNDILPIHFIINRAKTYRIFECYKQHGYKWFFEKLLLCMNDLKGKRLSISDKWIDDSVLKSLIEAWQKTEQYDDISAIFIKAIILLSVRQLASITKSKNPTWLKFGGISSGKDLEEIIGESLTRFDQYYSYHYEAECIKTKGYCIFTNQNAAEIRLPQKADIILTSPPYCNRLDYIVQYGPENYFLSALGNSSPEKDLIGTTKVRNYETLEKDFKFLTNKSKYANRLLNKIKNSRKADDPGYYLKYYTHYFAVLFQTITNVLDNLAPTGKMYIVTQDNTHRGQLVEIDRLLRELLKEKGWKSKEIKRWERHHLGLQTVSKDHAFVRTKQFEKLVVIWQ